MILLSRTGQQSALPRSTRRPSGRCRNADRKWTCALLGMMSSRARLLQLRTASATLPQSATQRQGQCVDYQAITASNEGPEIFLLDSAPAISDSRLAPERPTGRSAPRASGLITPRLPTDIRRTNRPG